MALKSLHSGPYLILSGRNRIVSVTINLDPSQNGSQIRKITALASLKKLKLSREFPLTSGSVTTFFEVTLDRICVMNFIVAGDQRNKQI